MISKKYKREREREDHDKTTEILWFNNSKISSIILSRITIHAGTNLLNQSGTVYAPKNITYHKKFNRSRLANDIAIITLKKEIKYTKLIKPIPLAIEDIAPGHSCVLSGWGRTLVSDKYNRYSNR